MEYPQVSGIGCTPMAGSCKTESELQRISQHLNFTLTRIESASHDLAAKVNRIKREKMEPELANMNQTKPMEDDFCSAAWQTLARIDAVINNIERVNRHLDSVA